MFKLNRNDKAFKELETLAKQHKLPLPQFLVSDEHLDKVSEIFYSYMPKIIKFATNQEKFKEFYKANREQFVKAIKFK
jgi:hypothetical protein